MFGNLYSVMGISAFLFQLFFTSRIHRLLGVGFAMRVLPVTVALGTSALLLAPMFFPAAVAALSVALKIGENGLRYSLDASTRELLFVPVGAAQRRKAKAYVDVLGQRAAKGIAAVLLLTVTFGWITVPQAGWISLVLCAVWLVATFSLRREYVRALREGLASDRPADDDDGIHLDDVTTLRVLVESLGSVDSSRVLRSVELLATHGGGSLVPPLLLYHDDPEVRELTLRVLAQEGRVDSLHLIEKLIGDENADVRAEAVTTLAHLMDKKGPTLMAQRLHDADIRVRSAAIACLANHGDEDQIGAAEASLVELISDADLDYRREAAKALGRIEDPLYRQHVVTLLYDPSHKVVIEAIEAVHKRGQTKRPSPLYVPILISLLRHRDLKRAARTALAVYGKRVVPALRHFMFDDQEHIWVRRHIPMTLARLGDDEAVDALLDALQINDHWLRRAAINALSSLPFEYWSGPERRKLKDRIASESEQYLETLAQLAAVSRDGAFVMEAARVRWQEDHEATLLEQLLAESLEAHKENVLLLLALLRRSSGVEMAKDRLLHSRSKKHGQALEYLDNVLEGEVRRSVFAVLDDQPLERRLQKLRTAGHTKSRLATLRALIHETAGEAAGAPWLATAALQYVALGKVSELEPEIEQVAAVGRHPLLVETAEWVLLQVRDGSAA